MRKGWRSLVLSLGALARPAAAAAPEGASPAWAAPPDAVAVDAPSVGEGKRVLAAMDGALRSALLADGVAVNASSSPAGAANGTIQAWLEVRQPRAVAFRLLTDSAAHQRYLPHVTQSDVVARAENAATTLYRVDMGLFSVRTRVRITWWPEVSRIAWALDPTYDNDLVSQVGYYNVYALDASTSLLEYGTRVQATSLVPRSLQDYLTQRDLPAALRCVKSWLDSGGTWTR